MNDLHKKENKQNKKNKDNKETRLIGQGTAGCVFRNPLKCKDPEDNKRLNNVMTKNLVVGKVFADSYHSNDEMDSYKQHVSPINAENKFTTKLHMSCPVDVSSMKEQTQDFYKCKQTKHKDGRERTTLYQVVFDDGGSDLEVVSKGLKIHFLEFFAHLGPIFEGLVRLEQKQVVHQDIKPNNIVFNGSTNRMTLIDFGLIKSGLGVLTPKNIRFLEYNYHYYPPEYRIFAKIYKAIKAGNELKNLTELNTDSNFDDQFQKYNNNIIKYLEYFNIQNDAKHILFIGTSLYKETRQDDGMKLLFKTIKEYYSQKGHFYTFENKSKNDNDIIYSIIGNMWRKVDTYMFGVTLYEVLYMYFRYSVQYMDDKIELDKYTNIYKRIGKLFIRMLSPDPFKRISPKQALNMYISILKQIPQYFVKGDFLLKAKVQDVNNSQNYNNTNNIMKGEKSDQSFQTKIELIEKSKLIELQNIAKLMNVPKFSQMKKLELQIQLLSIVNDIPLKQIPPLRIRRMQTNNNN
jgi:serine/threonine protein kinase